MHTHALTPLNTLRNAANSLLLSLGQKPLRPYKKRRPQSDVFSAWLYYNGQQDKITFAEFRTHVWPTWISIFRYDVYKPQR